MTVRTCDRISEQIHLLVDKELGPAEEAVVEKHLHECPRCQIVAARLERMSSVLKTWDAECNDHDAPALRLRNAVLARVAEQSAVRRRETRLDNLVQFATAACVLLAIGLAVVFAFGGDEAAPAAPYLADTAPSPLATASVSETAVTETEFAAWLRSFDFSPKYKLEELPEPSGPAWEPRKIEAEESAGRLAFVMERILRVAELSEVLGTQAMACYMPSLDGHVPRTMPVTVYRYLRDRGHIKEWRKRAEGLDRSTTVEPSSSADDAPLPRKTGKVARELLAPMPGLGDEKLTKLFERPPLKLGGAAEPIEALRLRAPRPTVPPLASTPLDPSPAKFLDPVSAQSSKQLQLGWGGDAGTVIALVQGTGLPIFIPAGQLLTGGIADRVVAQPVWLPPAKEKTPYVIPCRVVENFPDGNADEQPMIQPWIAGPTIRALLAAGASQAEVKEAARLQVEGFGVPAKSMWRDWSLRDIYAHPKARENMARVTRGYRVRDDDNGFVAIDGQGRLLGIEVVRLKGPAAAALLHRLWNSYAVEAVLRAKGVSTQAIAAPGEGLERAMRRIANHNGSFRKPEGFTQIHGTRVSSVEIEAAGIHIHALETDEKPTVISGLSSPTR